MPDLPVNDAPIEAPDTTATGVDPATPPSPAPDTLPPGMGPMPTVDPWIGEEQKKELAKLKGAQAAEVAGVETKVKQMTGPRGEMMAALNESRPQMPKLEPYRDPPEIRVNDAEEFKKYMMPMLAFTMLLGRVFRADGVDGLNMLSAGMRGYHEGRIGYANHMMEQWKAKMEKVRAENQRRIDDYQKIVDDRNASIQEKQVRMQLVAAQNDDAIMMATLKKQNIMDTLKTLGTMSAQQDKFIRTQVYYQNAVAARSARLEMIHQHQLDRQEREREFDERMSAAADRDATKAHEKYAKAYNDGIGKILAAGRSSMQAIMRNPYLQMRKDWQESAVNALANNMSGEMQYANNKLRVIGLPVDAQNEALEDAATMKNYLTLGPAALGVDMGRPAPGAAPAQPVPEGAIIPDR